MKIASEGIGKTEDQFAKVNQAINQYPAHLHLHCIQTCAVFSKASGIAAANRFSGRFSGIENGTVGVDSGTGKTGNTKNQNGLQVVLKLSQEVEQITDLPNVLWRDWQKSHQTDSKTKTSVDVYAATFLFLATNNRSDYLTQNVKK